MFSTNNCQYCDLAEKDFKEQPSILNKFKEAIKIKVEYTEVVNPSNEMILTEKLYITSFKDHNFIRKLSEYTQKQTLLKAAANADKFPTFTVVTLDKNNSFIGVGSSEGYPGPDKFMSNMNDILSKDNRVLFKKRFPIDY